MILDTTNLFSDDQAITATAASTNIIDLGSSRGDISKGVAIPLLVRVTEAFNNLTNLAIAIQTDSVEAFSSPKTVVTQTILLADLVAGSDIAVNYIPNGTDEQYLRVYYTVTGTAPTTGKITAGVVMALDQRGF